MTHTSTEQPEALRLADWLDAGGWPSYVPQESAEELRRLHSRVQELEATVETGKRLLREEMARSNRYAEAAQAQRAPLTNEECDRLISALCPDFCDQRFPGDRPTMRKLARGALHSGITQEKQG